MQLAQENPSTTIRLPYKFTPRTYQVPVLAAMDRGIKRGCWVVHRRGGKDRTFLAYTSKAMFEKPAAYYHFFPTYKQAKKVIWDALDPQTGRRVIDEAFPLSIFPKRNETDLKITARNGALYQLVGSDNFDSIMGTNPLGCIFSEYALQDPRAWDYIRPILAENGGWAVFIYTPRGHNHGEILYAMAQSNPDWFCELLTVLDTKRDDGSPVISQGMIEAERAAGMDEALIEQEFYCSFEGYMQGSYLSKQLRQARMDGRIGNVPHLTQLEVDTFWDLGVDDSMSIWFLQSVGKERRFIDYLEDTGYGLEHYAKELKNKPYVYGNHYMPHDAAIREMTNSEIALSRKEVAENLGVKPVQLVSRVRNLDTIIQVQIPAMRTALAQCWFDKTKCARGIAALEGYRSEYDEEKKVLSRKPLHDWCAHGADAFRTFAVGYQEKTKAPESTGSRGSRGSGGSWGGLP